MSKDTQDDPEKIGLFERKARRQLIEELFYDMYQSKRRVYWVNFWRGVSFGFGTLIGGTVVVALIVWILGWVVGWLPVGDDSVKDIVEIFREPNPTP
jgi:hypothetical protein